MQHRRDAAHGVRGNADDRQQHPADRIASSTQDGMHDDRRQQAQRTESDRGQQRTGRRTPAARRADWRLPVGEYQNDLQPPVAARHPEIDRIARALVKRGATYAAMSGSGSTVFGLFDAKLLAGRAAAELSKGHRQRALVTRTLSRARYASFSAPRDRTGKHLPAKESIG